MISHHLKFSIHIALQLIGLTTEKLLPITLGLQQLFQGIDIDDTFDE